MAESKEVEVTEVRTSKRLPRDVAETAALEAQAAEEKKAWTMFARHFKQAQAKARAGERAKWKAAEQRQQDILEARKNPQELAVDTSIEKQRYTSTDTHNKQREARAAQATADGRDTYKPRGPYTGDSTAKRQKNLSAFDRVKEFPNECLVRTKATSIAWLARRRLRRSNISSTSTAVAQNT